MLSLTCCGGSTLAALGRAAGKAAGARLRRLGLLRQSVDWARRARVCASCPLQVMVRKAAYCGRPFLRQIERIPAEEGCGCPISAKSRDPGEHCPLDRRNRPAGEPDGSCTCKWCG
jgi:hypothetical protein